jgi:hypothetical protein
LTESENKKLPIVYIGLEPDMFFEITDCLRDVVIRYEYEMKYYSGFKEDAVYQRKYLYLKSIIALLETQLTE